MNENTTEPIDLEQPIGLAYDNGKEIFICGQPKLYGPEVAEDDPRQHNCDQMGCGRDHVIARFPK